MAEQKKKGSNTAGTQVEALEGAADDPIEMPIDGTLDLHTFLPKEIGDLIPHYLEECLAREIYQVRIVHGKGKGVLRRSVHAILERLPQVESFRQAGEGGGGWGATLVVLKGEGSGA